MARTQDMDEAVRLLRHRGPDDAGTWWSGNVALGFRRLAIQDLSSQGNQPMRSGDGRYVVVFNGEIYNFKLLRKALCAKGHVFRTGTDTEVLLKLYELEGRECLQRLDGMFAFAVYDTLDRSLFLARDRFGEKPLYTLQDAHGFLFASEIKALLPFVRRFGMSWELNTDRVFEYMLFRYVAGEDTLIRGVRRVKAGAWIEVGPDGSTRDGVYYDVGAVVGSFNPEVGERREVEHLKEVHQTFTESVRLRMISDAPIGVALSGGVDSSLITAAMREVHDGPIQSFSIIFNEKQVEGRTIDESSYSDLVAQTCDTTHHRLTLDEGLFADLYPKCLWHNDEPLNFPNAIGIYLLANFASEQVKVLLSGEGADETFAGYPYFLKSGLNPLKHRFARVTDVRGLLSAAVSQKLSGRRALVDRCPYDGINGEIYVSVHSYLTTIENRLDKMSMANGLEMRLPFLDPRMVELSLRLPDRYKVRGSTTKYLLKKLAERRFPHAHIYRTKIGFSTPLNRWLRNRRLLGRYVNVLAEERTLERPIYNNTGLRALLNHFWQGDDTFRFSVAGRVWILMNLELWIRMFLEGEGL